MRSPFSKGIFTAMNRQPIQSFFLPHTWLPWQQAASSSSPPQVNKRKLVNEETSATSSSTTQMQTAVETRNRTQNIPFSRVARKAASAVHMDVNTRSRSSGVMTTNTAGRTDPENLLTQPKAFQSLSTI